MDYKKILEDVVDIINTTEKSDIGFANICTYIGENCPELKESEGERVKKDIKRAISVALDYSYFDKETANNCLAWIEKQGEYANFRNKIQIGDKVTRNKDGVLVNMSQLNRVAKIDEKQGEQSKNEDKDILHRFSFYSYKDEPNILYLAGLYVDDEYRNKGIGTKILKVANEVAASIKCNSIRLKTEKGSHAEKLYRENGYTTIFEEENQIWLEKQAEQKPTIEMITPEESLGVDSDTYNKIVDECIYGEQKPTDKYEGLTDFERTLADICVGWIGEELGWKQYIKDNADVLLKIAIKKFNSVQDVAFEQKPAWSEEDEAHINGIIDYLLDYKLLVYEEDMNVANGVQKELDWLKSLKQRIGE